MVKSTMWTLTPSAMLVMRRHFKLVCKGDRLESHTFRERATTENLAHQEFWRVTNHAEEAYVPRGTEETFPWGHVRMLYGLTPGMAESLRGTLQIRENLFSICDEASGKVLLSPQAIMLLRAHIIAERFAFAQRSGSAAPELDMPIEAVLEAIQRPDWAADALPQYASRFSCWTVGRGAHRLLFQEVPEPAAEANPEPVAG